MIIFKYKKHIITFIVCSLLILILFLLIEKIFSTKQKTYKYNEVITSKINYHDSKTNIRVLYPRFYGNNEINKIVSDNIYEYVKEFKTFDIDKTLKINYTLFYIDNLVNIQYKISNSLNNITNKNILINLDTNKVSYITSIYDEKLLLNEIHKQVTSKYSESLYAKISKDTINNYNYIFEDDSLLVYFNNIGDAPFITINTKDLKEDYNNEIIFENNNPNKKYISLTFDDGPSSNTLDLLEMLESSNSSATFFWVGNRMKSRKDIVKKVYNSNSEIGSHSYSHKNMTKISEEEINYELNSTNLIYNQITNDNLKLFRPPYGSYNKNLLNKNYIVVTWNVDTKDWLVKDKDKVFNSVKESACDGCIVLMHETHTSTIEAMKMIIPYLKENNYEIVSISKLMKIKNYTYDSNKVIRHLK